MYCLKCGREIDGKDVFCPECVKVMAASPVKPGTTVTLPRRDKIERKPQSRKQVKPEEQITRLQKTVRRLWIAVAAAVTLLVIVCAALAVEIMEPNATPNLGQNYNTTDTGITPKGPR